MSKPTIEMLVERLDRLERENRWLKHIRNLMLVGIAGLLIMGQLQRGFGNAEAGQATKIVEAEQFIVKDKNGKKRAELQTFGFPLGSALVLYDEKGKARVDLIFADTGYGQLAFFDEDGKPLVRLSASNDGVSLSLEGKEGYSAVLGSTKLETPKTGTVTKRAESSLVLFDKDRKIIWSAP